jgi:hypothetical protein
VARLARLDAGEILYPALDRQVFRDEDSRADEAQEAAQGGQAWHDVLSRKELLAVEEYFWSPILEAMWKEAWLPAPWELGAANPMESDSQPPAAF